MYERDLHEHGESPLHVYDGLPRALELEDDRQALVLELVQRKLALGEQLLEMVLHKSRMGPHLDGIPHQILQQVQQLLNVLAQTLRLILAQPQRLVRGPQLQQLDQPRQPEYPVLRPIRLNIDFSIYRLPRHERQPREAP